MRIELVSDVVCPWCAVVVHSLEKALEQVADALGPVDVEFQPFELNPDMPAGGVETIQYLSSKFGMSEAHIRAGHDVIRQRGAAVGFVFGDRPRVWNTFDAHRLVYWAAKEGGLAAQRRLAKALLAAYHGEGRDVSAPDVLVELAGTAGLDVNRAADVLGDRQFSDEVRQLERQWREAGISAVPSVVVDRRHLIQGAQTPEVFASALWRIAKES